MSSPPPPAPTPASPEIPDARPTAVPLRLSSAALFRGGRELQIDHRGEVYRLRQTAQGKLILTK